jgi:hypothetical protein
MTKSLASKEKVKLTFVQYPLCCALRFHIHDLICTPRMNDIPIDEVVQEI